MAIRNIAGNIQPLLLSHLIVSVLFLLIIVGLDLTMNPLLIFVYGCLSASLYFILLKREWEASRDLSVEIVYLAACFFRFIIPTFVTSWLIFNDIKILYLEDDVSDYSFPTIVWMNIFHVIFYTIFKLKSNNISIGSRMRVLFKKYDVFFIVAAIYIICTPLRAFNNLLIFLNVSQAVMSLFNNIGNLCLILLLFNCSYKYSPFRHFIFILLCATEFIYAGLFTFYKVNMIMPVLFYMAFWIVWHKSENKKVITKPFIVLCLSSFVLINSFVFPFMYAKRIVSGFSVEMDAGTNNYSMADVFDHMKSARSRADNNSSTLLDRQNAVPVNSFFYKDVNCKNQYHTEILKKSVLISIPRIIYPGKPYNNVGMMVTEYVRTGIMFDDCVSTSYTYAGLVGGSYLWGGPIGLLLCAILGGFFMSAYNNFLLRNIKNPLAILFYMSFLVMALAAFEETHDGGIGRLVSLIQITILVKITSLILMHKK